MKGMKTRCLAILLLGVSLCSWGQRHNHHKSVSDSVPPIGTISPTREWPDTTSAFSMKESVGLVLSGGGAKGVAHVGVIKALEDNDIPIDYVTGTSMGAIVGSLYSCGWSPERMMKLFTSQDFLDWSMGVIPKEDTFYYIKPNPTPQWVELNINFNNTENITNQIIPTSLISPLPMNIEFLNLYGAYSEQCGENFNNLFVPFRCVTSDIYHKHKVVLSKGSLGDAVRASMSFPLVFRPIKMDGVLVYDGGIYDNFPVNVMRDDFHPDFMIGVSVSGADTAPEQGNIYSQLEDMIIQNNDYSLPEKEGVKIQVPVLNFGVLQFDKAKAIYEIGYKTGLAMVDSIKSRLKARRPLEEVTKRREVFASQTPELIFDSVRVTGANPSQSKYLKFLFDKGENKPFGMEQTLMAYYRAVTDGTLNNLFPQAEFGKNGHNTLLLEASLKRPWWLGVGGWISTTTNNMLFLTAGYHTLDLNSLNVTLNGWLGQSYFAGQLSGRFTLRSRIPSLLELEGVASRQKYYDSKLLFYETNSPAFITEDEYFIRANYIWSLGRKVKGVASLAGGALRDSYYPDNSGSYIGRDKDYTHYRMGVLKAKIEKNTLNHLMYPSQGENWEFAIIGVYEQSNFQSGEKDAKSTPYTGHFWGGISALWNRYFDLHRYFKLGVMANGKMVARTLTQNYVAELVHSTPFAPTPSLKSTFNEAFRSDNFLAAGVIPMWTPIQRFQLRGDFYLYSPIRRMENRGMEPAVYNGWFKDLRFIGELAAVYNFPFASISAYVNYLSYPAKNWNFGLSFGLYFPAPKLIH